MRRTLVLATLLLLVGSGVAQAHIQVTPATAAPGDSALFTVLVPGERDPKRTTKVQLQIPAGVLPFSFEDTPGWTRKLVNHKDGSIDQVVWTGKTEGDGFVRFAFLAGLPDKAGTLKWKALQTYSDKKIVRWIGAAGSDYPAAITDVRKGVAKQNAGGEGSGEDSGTAPATGGTSAGATSGSDDDDGQTDWVARGMGLVGLLAGGAALGVVLTRRRLAGGA